MSEKSIEIQLALMLADLSISMNRQNLAISSINLFSQYVCEQLSFSENDPERKEILRKFAHMLKLSEGDISFSLEKLNDVFKRYNEMKI